MSKLTFATQVLKFLHDNADYEYTISDLSKQFKIAPCSLYSILWNASQSNTVEKIKDNGTIYWAINNNMNHEEFHHVSKLNHTHTVYLNKVQKVLNKLKSKQFKYNVFGTKVVCITNKDFLNTCVEELDCTMRTAYNFMKYLIVIEYFERPHKKSSDMNKASQIIIYNSKETIHDYLNNLNKNII